MKRIFIIDGKNFSTLDEFFDEVSRTLIPGTSWGRNLDAFNDILRGGFGTPDNGLVIHWINSSVSRTRLGFPETISYIEKKLRTCHSSNIKHVQDDLRDAQNGIGQTLFDIIVDIVRTHCKGGEEEEDGVELLLV